MFSLALITIACIFGVVSGTPSARQASCRPNFEGTGVTIVTGAVEGAVSRVVAGRPLKIDGAPFLLNSTANWQVDQTTSTKPTYILKQIGNDKLVVDVVDGELTLAQTDSSKQAQIWEIECKQCLEGASSIPGGGKFASLGCSIKSAATGLCATLDTASGVLGLADCSPAGAQTFYFWSATTGLRSRDLNKRCDMDQFDACFSGCGNIPNCPGCEVGCTIGCCGSTGCC
ncbi:hypothetical protein GGX14DRAFT_621135 [Mycena pura]|uniref:Ricin B lectin domain-containing protein n=1 Tax=Mycena pura TaxID=153505 RepID=A0AAD6VI75_9AGAR|nr:hypothetical protein GGX14DRAFT_621135 [Mycena pura]